jgi:serine/threonine protein kinase
MSTHAYGMPMARALAVAREDRASSDQRADIWASGCVLVELLAGRSPFARPRSAESLAAVLDHTPRI